MRLIYHPEAEAELMEAAQFYETRVPQLGARFSPPPTRCLSFLRRRSAGASLKWTWRYAMRQFPYFIYYRVLPDHVRILAFAHHRRHPDYWRERLA